jgi:uncharacterized membrane protein
MVSASAVAAIAKPQVKSNNFFILIIFFVAGNLSLVAVKTRKQQPATSNS